MAVVYLHRRKDTNEVFYVGIGKKKRRAYVRAKRNTHWKNIVKKVGYNVEIAFNDVTYDEAMNIEQELISLIGRSDKGQGPLVNMTDGGEGTRGLEPHNKGIPLTEEIKNKMSVSLKKTLSKPEVKEKMRNAKLGTTHTQEWKDKMSLKMKEMGNKPPQTQSTRIWTKESRNKVKNNQKGEGNSNSVLTEDIVRFIKTNYIPRHKEFGGSALARRFGVKQGTVSDIINGKNWAWVKI